MNTLQINKNIDLGFGAIRIRCDLRYYGDSLCGKFQVVFVQSDGEAIPNFFCYGAYRVSVFVLAVSRGDRNGFDLAVSKIPMQ